MITSIVVFLSGMLIVGLIAYFRFFRKKKPSQNKSKSRNYTATFKKAAGKITGRGIINLFLVALLAVIIIVIYRWGDAKVTQIKTEVVKKEKEEKRLRKKDHFDEKKKVTVKKEKKNYSDGPRIIRKMKPGDETSIIVSHRDSLHLDHIGNNFEAILLVGPDSLNTREYTLTRKTEHLIHFDDYDTYYKIRAQKEGTLVYRVFPRM